MEFKPVEVTKSFLGIKKGTTLKFDGASSKYISMAAEEEIGDNEYYYSGHAIQIDPVVVKNNLGKYFEIKELPAKEEPVAVEESTTMDAPAEPIEVHEKLEVEEEKDLPIPEDATTFKPADLMFDCGLCHFNNKIVSVKYGVFLPASKETSLKLKCGNCGIETNIYYKVEDETTEESKQV